MKIDLANLAVGAKTVKQLSRAVGKLAQTLTKMEDGGGVSLEAPVTGKAVNLVTQDAKLARRFGMEEGRAPRGAKTAAPAAKKAAGAAQAAATPAPAKKAATKKAAAKKARAQAAPTDGAPAAEAIDVTLVAKRAAQKAAVKKAPAKKAAGKKAARKTVAKSSNEPARAAGGESAAAPEAPPAIDTPGAEASAS
ncbi:hypothetical protein [Azohydromonas australica]|uniref:hypothetical protein n=1 Tax=Azohydromonas australica TaxID=364039 RepID=UPI000A02FA86|nr:hypothetical protein [Azohydromonas australica]